MPCSRPAKAWMLCAVSGQRAHVDAAAARSGASDAAEGAQRGGAGTHRAHTWSSSPAEELPKKDEKAASLGRYAAAERAGTLAQRYTGAVTQEVKEDTSACSSSSEENSTDGVGLSTPGNSWCKAARYIKKENGPS
jgi:hypothetical protein